MSERVKSYMPVIVQIIILIIGLAFSAGIAQSQVGAIEKRVKDLENLNANKIETETRTQKQLQEIQINLKILMKKQNLEYTRYTE